MGATRELAGWARVELAEWDCGRGRKKSLSVEQALRMTLVYLRRNQTYAELADDSGIGVSTAWAYVQEIVEFLASVFHRDEESLRCAVAGKVVVVDGTLVPVFNWRHRKDLWSGKHRRSGMNVQVVADLHGQLVSVAGPYPGSWHDSRCYRESGFTAVVAATGGLADAGYQGSELVTPRKKAAGVGRYECDREFNTDLAKLRVAVEWTNAYLKNWRILASRYRSDLKRMTDVVAVVAGLVRLSQHHSPRRLLLSRLATIDISE